jgi:hypothetical protein
MKVVSIVDRIKYGAGYIKEAQVGGVDPIKLAAIDAARIETYEREVAEAKAAEAARCEANENTRQGMEEFFNAHADFEGSDGDALRARGLTVTRSSLGVVRQLRIQRLLAQAKQLIATSRAAE